jgi:type II secretion system protein E
MTVASLIHSDSINAQAALAGGFEWIDLEDVKPEEAAIRLAPGDFALTNQVLPIQIVDNVLVAAIGTPESLSAVDDLGVLLQMTTRAVLASPALVKEKIEEIFLERILAGLPGQSDEGAATAEFDDTTDLADLQKMAGETAVVQMVNLMFAQAVRDGASDIHVEPYEREMTVRFRVDGLLREVLTPPKRMHAAIVSRLKILGEMNIAERRLPQDGRIKIVIAGRNIDVRVSIVPTVFGERVVMRILDKGTAMLGLEDLGMRPDTLAKFRKIIRNPHGVILATGPTGSGKSTSLYASLQEIWSPTTNILTIEDPVEYQVAGIGQIQVRPQIGLTFSNGLRTIVRQDPDIIMVGEIRDFETAEIAIQAALTGHLVFSTLHTNDAAGAVTRLLDMGVEPYLVASSLIAAIAQRLVRRVCQNCSEPYTPEPDILHAIGISSEDWGASSPFRRGQGCDRCLNTGYRGRVGLYELFVCDETIRRLTVARSASNDMKDWAMREQGMRSLLQDGKLAVLEGKTSPEEVMRVCARESF